MRIANFNFRFRIADFGFSWDLGFEAWNLGKTKNY